MWLGNAESYRLVEYFTCNLDLKEWYYGCCMPLPTFTLSIAIGFWEESTLPNDVGADETAR